MITFFLFRRIGRIEIIRHEQEFKYHNRTNSLATTIAINIFPHLGKWLKPS